MPDGIAIFSLRESDIIFASKTARRAISLGGSRISLRSNITRRKANITEKDLVLRQGLFLGGSGWIRTTEVEDNRFTVCPLWPLGNTPIFSLIRWSWWTDATFFQKFAVLAA